MSNSKEVEQRNMQMTAGDMRRARKTEWQRNQRARFAAEHGFSTTADYGCGGLRKAVLARDGYRCVGCGMADAEHKATWDRPITVDHKDKDRSHNTMRNLQTMCLTCHGRKDIIPRLTVQQVPKHKDSILQMRSARVTYQAIADHFNFSIGSVWKWCRRWEKEIG